MHRAPGAHHERDRPRLVLVGGGHAHLHVLRSLADDDWPDVECILVSPDARQLYSAMVPGYLQGSYRREQLEFDLGALCAASSTRLVTAAATRIDADRRVVETQAGPLEFTLASLDVGSSPRGAELPGVADHAFSLRPMQGAVSLRRRIDELARARAASDEDVRVVVVGAGAGGIEVALALHRRIRLRGARPWVVVVDRAARALDGESAGAQRRAAALLRRRGVVLRLGSEGVAVDPDGLRLADGGRVDADLVSWISGPAPPPLLARSSVPLSPDGYFAVDATLRALGGGPVWGAGDCIDIDGVPLAKAGVYAVREGPILAANLRAALTGQPARPYRPQRSFLSILNTADDQALLRWRGLVHHSRAAWWLKDRIDRRFMAGYAVER